MRTFPGLARSVAPGVLGLAVAAFAAAAELPPNLQEAFARGVEQLKSGRLDEAEAAFRAVLDAGGDVAFVHNNLGIVLQQRGRHEAAAAEFRKAALLDPGYVPPRILLGASLLALGRVDEALPPLEEAVRRAPDEPLARLQLAKAYEHARSWPAAVEQYQALVRLEPRDPEHAFALGRAYLEVSEWCLAQLKANASGEARLQQALGHNYRVQGRPDLAVRAFERAARADPSLPEVHLALAQVHAEERRWEEARREIALELEVVPGSAGARALLRQIEARAARAP